MIAFFIIACEVGFWIFVLAGLAARYLLGRKRLGTALLLCTPIIDLALLAATVLDLRNGAEAGFFHGLAAIYIGVSIGFGHRMISWADQQFAYRFAGGAAPVKPPKKGADHARRERRLWFLHFLGWGIGCMLLYGMIWLAGEHSNTDSLRQTIKTWSIVLAVDFVWSFSYTLWPRK